MGNADPDFDWHDLARCPQLRVVRWVVRKLQAFAEEEVARRGVVGGVFGCELGETVR